MKSLQLKNLSTAALQGYSGKAVTWKPNYVWDYAAKVLIDQVDEATKTFQGPLYQGEAHAFLMEPLVTIARKITNAKSTENSAELSKQCSSVINTMYGMALNYAIIAEIFTYAQIKEVARELSSLLISTSPLYNALGGKTGIELQSEQEGGKKNNVAWSYIAKWIDGQANSPTPGEVAKSFLYPEEIIVNDTSLSGSYAILTRKARSGKGMPLLESRRQAYLDEISLIKSAIAVIFQTAEGVTDQYQRSRLYLNGLALANAFLRALSVMRDEDSYFPTSPLQSMVQQWAASMKVAALRLVSHWAGIALDTLTPQIEIAVALWNEQLHWTGYLGKDLGVLADAKSILDDEISRFDLMRSKWYGDMVHGAFNNYKKYFKADTVLRETPTTQAMTQLLTTTSSSTADAKSIFATVTPSLKQVPLQVQPGSKVSYRWEDKANIHASLALDAQAIAAAIQYALQARSLITLDPSPLDRYDAIGSIDTLWPTVNTDVTRIVNLGFTRPDPIEAAAPKFIPSNQTLKESISPFATAGMDAFLNEKNVQPYAIPWIRLFEYAPVYQFPLQNAMIATDPVIMFPTSADYPSPDVISAQYYMQPIPANYTATRNRAVLPYNIMEYLALQQGAVKGASYQDYLHTIAQLIATYPNEVSSSLALALSATFLIYKNGTEVIAPVTPTIYGVPTAAFIAQQEEKYAALSDAKKAEMAISIDTDNEEISSIEFRLHLSYPKMDECRYVLFSPSRGVAYSAPLAAKFYDLIANQNYTQTAQQAATDRASVVVGAYVSSSVAATYSDPSKIEWTDAFGFSPFTRCLPHINFQVWKLADIATDTPWREQALFSLTRKIDPITGDLNVRVQYENPVVIFDYEDELGQLEAADPEPQTTATVSQAESIRDENATEREGAVPTEPDPVPTTILNGTQAQAANQAAEILSVPVPNATEAGGNILVQTTTLSETPTTTHQANLGEIIAGDSNPASNAAPQVNPVIPTRYYKVVKGDKTEIVPVKAGDPVPTGGVPASQEEIDEYLGATPRSDKESDGGQ